jgi:hypothetical protein
MRIFDFQTPYILVIFVSFFLFRSFQSNACSFEFPKSSEFKEENFELDGTKIFEISNDELIKKFNLKLISENNGIRRFNGKSCIILVNNLDKVIYFEIFGKNHLIKNPFLSIGEKIKSIEKKYPNLISNIYESEFYGKKIQIISLFSKNNNELRIQVKDSRIHSFVYLNSEEQ